MPQLPSTSTIATLALISFGEPLTQLDGYERVHTKAIHRLAGVDVDPGDSEHGRTTGRECFVDDLASVAEAL